jgi:hypothetical protein
MQGHLEEQDNTTLSDEFQDVATKLPIPNIQGLAEPMEEIFTKVTETLIQIHQNHPFEYDRKLLALKGYDMVLGANGLAKHNPNYINLEKMSISLTVKGKWCTFTTRAVSPNNCTISVKVPNDTTIFDNHHAEVIYILQECKDNFQEQTSLPLKELVIALSLFKKDHNHPMSNLVECSTSRKISQ